MDAERILRLIDAICAASFFKGPWITVERSVIQEAEELLALADGGSQDLLVAQAAVHLRPVRPFLCAKRAWEAGP